MEYKKEDKLKLTKRIYITEEEYRLLRKQKKKQGISMAKIVCNLIKKNYGQNN